MKETHNLTSSAAYCRAFQESLNFYLLTVNSSKENKLQGELGLPIRIIIHCKLNTENNYLFLVSNLILFACHKNTHSVMEIQQ